MPKKKFKVVLGSSLASDFDVEDYLDGESTEKTEGQTEDVDTIIQNYTKSLVYCGTDDSKEAVFAVFARYLPQDVKTNYNYDPAMTALLKVSTYKPESREVAKNVRVYFQSSLNSPFTTKDY